MDPESVLWSKVTQKEKNKYTNAYIWNLKNGTDEHNSRAGIEVWMLRLDM